MTDGLVWDAPALFEETLTGDAFVAAQVGALQEMSGGSSGFRLRRVILVNFWLYGYQEFHIPHGRLFLAGENASGKSSILAAALPIALDGNTAPTRVDTFGGNGKRLDYYVLGSTDAATVFSHDRRTCYIALEWEWCDPHNPPIAAELRDLWYGDPADHARARWLTTGLCLAGNASRADKLTITRFALTDGARIGHDVHLTDSRNAALDPALFKRSILNAHGMAFDTMTDYQTFVARALFGITNPDDFHYLIQMLLVLRNPDLGQKQTVESIQITLTTALRRIPDDITRRVTGTIERLDEIQSKIEGLESAHSAASRIDAALQNVVVARSRATAFALSSAAKAETDSRRAADLVQNQHARAETTLATARNRVSELRDEQADLAGRIAALRGSERFQVAEKLATAKNEVERAATRLADQQAQEQQAQHALARAHERLSKATAKRDAEAAHIVAEIRRLRALAAGWPLAASYLADATDDGAAGIAEIAGGASRARLALLARLDNLHAARQRLSEDARHARDVQDRALTVQDDARARRDAAVAELGAAREAVATRLREWGAGLDDVPEWALAELIRAARDSDSETMREAATNVTRYLTQAQNTLDTRLNALRATLAERHHQQNAAQTEYDRTVAETDIEPPRSPARKAARSALAAANIPALPLYALVDYAPDTPPEVAGSIEQALADAGLLDALVVRADDVTRADGLLYERGLADCRLSPFDGSPSTSAAVVPLTFDPAADSDPAWQTSVADILRTLAANPAFAYDPDTRRWHHGLLVGQAGNAAAEGYIGTASRRRVRHERIAARDAALTAAREALTRQETAVAAAQKEQAILTAARADLTAITTAPDVIRAEAARQQTDAAFVQTERALAHAQADHARARQRVVETDVALRQEAEGGGVPDAANDRAYVHEAQETTRTLADGCARLIERYTDAAERRTDAADAAGDVENATHTARRAAHLRTDAEAGHTALEAQYTELLRLSEDDEGGVEALVRRLADSERRQEVITGELAEAERDVGQADARLAGLVERVTETRQRADDSRSARLVAQDAFVVAATTYPAATLTPLLVRLESDPAGVATLLLADDDPAPDVAALDLAKNRALQAATTVFGQQRANVIDFGPQQDDDGLVTFRSADHVTPHGLMALLTGRIAEQRGLLNVEERDLFENFLLQEMAEAIRSHIAQAEEWVRGINLLLDSMPLVGERYSLDWQPLDDAQPRDALGQHIARQHRLLRKPAARLNPDERERLLEALRQEVADVRSAHAADATTSFRDLLARIFDYRDWFRFAVYTTPPGGTALRLTEQNMKRRSGAERLFAFYVPLFAAYAAAYAGVAAPGAPRIVALDEAFDKASAANTQRIMQFLVSQDFQWIMTGPAISGVGAAIPVSAEYQLMYEKGSQVATALPILWVGGEEQASTPL